MARFDYRCPQCQKVVEIEVVSTTKIESKRVVRKKCPDCNVYMKKMISAPSVHFKGTGFYSTDKGK